MTFLQCYVVTKSAYIVDLETLITFSDLPPLL